MSLITDKSWIVNELRHTDLGDDRLNMRLVQTASCMASNPGKPIHLSCGNRASTKGAYRLFANPQLDSQNILESHQMMTHERVKKCKLVLAIQDTSFINYSGHSKTSNLGSIGGPNASCEAGLIMHTTLGIDESGSPLGILTQKISAREPKAKTTRKKQKKLSSKKPIEKKESFKWLEALEETCEKYSAKDIKIVTIADRESDIFEFVEKANSMGAIFLIRSCHNRKSVDGLGLRGMLLAENSIGTYQVNLPSIRQRPGRRAEMEIRMKNTQIHASQRDRAARSPNFSYKSQDVCIIEAKEVGSVKDPIHWILITNDKTSTAAEALEKIAWYKKRWSIELFHRILKSGCKIEECRLQTTEKLSRYITLKSIIAVRIFQLQMSSRINSVISCNTELTEDEWKVLYMRRHKGCKPPDETPTLKDAVLWIAELGGYQNRKSDPPPGMQVIWRGWQTLQECMRMWESIAAL